MSLATATTITDLDALPAILTVEDVCRVLRVSKPTIYAAIRTGALPSFRVSRAIRLSRTAVLNFINNQGPQGLEQE